MKYEQKNARSRKFIRRGENPDAIYYSFLPLSSRTFPEVNLKRASEARTEEYETPLLGAERRGDQRKNSARNLGKQNLQNKPLIIRKSNNRNFEPIVNLLGEHDNCYSAGIDNAVTESVQKP